jgi:hypothetical protein
LSRSTRRRCAPSKSSRNARSCVRLQRNPPEVVNLRLRGRHKSSRSHVACSTVPPINWLLATLWLSVWQVWQVLSRPRKPLQTLSEKLSVWCIRDGVGCLHWTFGRSWPLPCIAAVMYLYQLYQSNMGQTAIGMFPLFVGAVSVEGTLPACGSDPTAGHPHSNVAPNFHVNLELHLAESKLSAQRYFVCWQGRSWLPASRSCGRCMRTSVWRR